MSDRASKARPGRSRALLRAGIVVAILCVLGYAGYRAWHWYAYEYRKTHEPACDASETNTDPVYTDEEFRATLARYLSDEQFDLDKVVASSYVVPGLKATRTMTHGKEVSMCASMVPQGVCVAGDHLLVTAYCASKTHNSVIYVINKDTHAYEKEVVLKGRPHVGGIAYDGDAHKVWVCGYDDEEETAYANVIDLDTLEKYDLDQAKAPCAYSASYPIYTIDRASFLDCYGGEVYIGHYANEQSATSTVQAFALREDGAPYTLDDIESFLNENVTPEGQMVLRGYLGLDDKEGDDSADAGAQDGSGSSADAGSDPDADDDSGVDAANEQVILPAGISIINGRIQGFTIDDEYTMLSQSGGPSDSKLYVFENGDGIWDLLRTAENAVETYTLPPMLEEISADQGHLYLCFESASYAYRARSNDKVDRIVVLEKKDV